jgi:transcriptional regulator with XRE-family HTH domain
MPTQRKSKPRSPDHAALAQAIELLIAEDPQMSQETVAFDGHLNIRQVNALVRGQSNPTYTTLLRLAEGLHVRLGELMTRADELRDMRSRR